MAHHSRPAVTPHLLDYAKPSQNRRLERLTDAVALLAILTVLVSGSVAWAMLMWHRR